MRRALRIFGEALCGRRLLACLLASVLASAGGVGVCAALAAAAEAPQAEFTGAVGYGIAVAMSADGSTAVVGQLGNSTSTDVPGAAHVFTSDGGSWTQQAELTATDASYDMLFGNAVAMSADGNTVIVGDPGECGYGLENCEHGAAYVFTRDGTTWTQQAELHGGPGFGGAVALSGDGNEALVGAGLSGYYGLFHAPGGNAPPTLFSRDATTWTQDATLSASDAAGPFENFGHAVALSADGDTALIGDPTQDEEAGSAYVFTGADATWTQQAKLTGSDAAKGWQFGTSVALSNDGQIALVGAPAPNAGSAYVFSDSGSAWSQQAELTPEDAEVSAFDGWFGRAVALDGDGRIALIGAPWAEEALGAAYAFAGEGPSWTQQAEFTIESATPYDYFGDAVALDGLGSTALIGRYDPGAYFFGVPPAHFVRPPPGSAPPAASGGGAPAPSTSAPGAVASASAGPPAAAAAQITGESISPAAFSAAPRGASALAASRRYGAAVTYTLNAASEVRFTIAQAMRGHEAPAGRCVKPARAHRGAPGCRRLLALPGSFTLAGKKGANRFRFTGRLQERRLALGSYELIATPIAGNLAGRAAAASFRIIG